MPRRAPLLSLLALAAVLFSAVPAHAAMNAYLVLKSAKAGDVKSEYTMKGHEGQLLVQAFTHDVSVGAGAHGKTFTITKDLDKASPVLRGLLGTDDTFSVFELRLWRPLVASATGVGTEEQFFTIALHGAKISSIVTRMQDIKNPELVKYPIREEVTFTYTSIDYTFVKGGVAGTSAR